MVAGDNEGDHLGLVRNPGQDLSFGMRDCLVRFWLMKLSSESTRKATETAARSVPGRVKWARGEQDEEPLYKGVERELGLPVPR